MTELEGKGIRLHTLRAAVFNNGGMELASLLWNVSVCHGPSLVVVDAPCQHSASFDDVDFIHHLIARFLGLVEGLCRPRCIKVLLLGLLSLRQVQYVVVEILQEQREGLLKGS
jgi:hypothetical protein